jgi:hypothetical protein
MRESGRFSWARLAPAEWGCGSWAWLATAAYERPPPVVTQDSLTLPHPALDTRFPPTAQGRTLRFVHLPKTLDPVAAVDAHVRREPALVSIYLLHPCVLIAVVCARSSSPFNTPLG